MEKIDVKEYLLLYGHWAALGISCCIVLFTLLWGRDSKVSDTVEKHEKWLQTSVIAQGTQTESSSAKAPVDYYEHIRNNWERLGNYRVLNFSQNLVADLRQAVLAWVHRDATVAYNAKVSAEEEDRYIWDERIGAFFIKRKSGEEMKATAISEADLNKILDIAERVKTEEGVIDVAEIQSYLARGTETEGEATVAVTENDIKDVLTRVQMLQNDLGIWKQRVFAHPGPDQHYLYQQALVEYRIMDPPAEQWMANIDDFETKVDEKENRHFILLTWTQPKEESLQPKGDKGKGKDKDKDKKQMTPIDGYIIFKEANDRGTVTQKYIEIRGKKNTRYTDQEVETKVTYTYRVCAYTENKDAKGGEKFQDISAMVPDLELHEETQKSLKEKDLSKGAWMQDLVRSALTAEQTEYIEYPYRIEFRSIYGNKVSIRIYRKMGDEEVSADAQVEKGNEIKGYLVKEEGDKKIRIDLEPKYVLVDIKRQQKFLADELQKRRLAELEKELFTLDAQYEADLKEGKFSGGLSKAFKESDHKVDSKKVKFENVDDSEFWGTGVDTGKWCVVPDRQSFVEIDDKEAAWLLTDGARLFLVLKVAGELKVYDPRKNNWVKDKELGGYVEKTIKCRIATIVNAIVYKDEKGNEITLMQTK